MKTIKSSKLPPQFFGAALVKAGLGARYPWHSSNQFRFPCNRKSIDCPRSSRRSRLAHIISNLIRTAFKELSATVCCLEPNIEAWPGIHMFVARNLCTGDYSSRTQRSCRKHSDCSDTAPTRRNALRRIMGDAESSYESNEYSELHGSQGTSKFPRCNQLKLSGSPRHIHE